MNAGYGRPGQAPQAQPYGGQAPQSQPYGRPGQPQQASPYNGQPQPQQGYPSRPGQPQPQQMGGQPQPMGGQPQPMGAPPQVQQARKAEPLTSQPQQPGQPVIAKPGQPVIAKPQGVEAAEVRPGTGPVSDRNSLVRSAASGVQNQAEAQQVNQLARASPQSMVKIAEKAGVGSSGPVVPGVALALVQQEKSAPDANYDEANADGTTGLRGCALTVPKYSKRLSAGMEELPSPRTRRSGSPAKAPPPSGTLTHGAWVPSGSGRTAPNQPSSAPSPPRKRVGLSPQRQSMPGLHTKRAVEKCHSDLYEDAFARQQRLRDMKQHVEQVQDREELKRSEKYGQSMKDWRRLYKLKDTRSQAEREDELIRKRKDKETKKQERDREQELDELRECTFRPILKKKQGERGRSPRGMRPEGMDPPSSLAQLLERQRTAMGSLQDLAAEDLRLREHLATVHAEYHDRIQREETQRVVIMLQDADTEGSAQRELIDRVRRMVAAGDDPEVAQRQIVEELVARSQDEVKRRVLDAFGPIQLEAEGKLYHKRLSLVHELESIEAQVVALRGGTLVQEARDLGFEFGLADKSRRTLPAVPVLSAMRMTTPVGNEMAPELPAGHFRAHSTSSSNPTPRHSPRLLTDRPLLRPSTPRSQAATSDAPSRMSSAGQQSLSGSVLQPASEKGDKGGNADLEAATSDAPSRMSSAGQQSLSGSVLQPASEKGDRGGNADLEASVRSASALSLASDSRGPQVATSSSAPLRPRLGVGAAPAAGAAFGTSSYPSGMPAVAVETNPGRAKTPDPISTPPSMGRDEVAVFPNGVPLGANIGTGPIEQLTPTSTTPTGSRAGSKLSQGGVAQAFQGYNPNMSGIRTAQDMQDGASGSNAGSRPRTPGGSFVDQLPGQMVQGRPGSQGLSGQPMQPGQPMRPGAPGQPMQPGAPGQPMQMQPGAPGQAMAMSSGALTPRSLAQRTGQSNSMPQMPGMPGMPQQQMQMPQQQMQQPYQQQQMVPPNAAQAYGSQNVRRAM